MSVKNLELLSPGVSSRQFSSPTASPSTWSLTTAVISPTLSTQSTQNSWRVSRDSPRRPPLESTTSTKCSRRESLRYALRGEDKFSEGQKKAWLKSFDTLSSTFSGSRHQCERLRDQVQVRQLVRLPWVSCRRNQACHRRYARRKGRCCCR